MEKRLSKFVRECFARLTVYRDRQCNHFRCDRTLVVKNPPVLSIAVIGEGKELREFAEYCDCNCGCLKAII